MKRLSCVLALGATIGVAGCSSGEDVYIETATTRSELCTLSRGEDVCARSWDGLPEATRAEAVTWLDAVATLSGEARAALDELDAACSEMLVHLAVDAPPVTDGATRAETTSAKCEAVASAIQLRRTTPLRGTRTAAECTILPPPSCVLSHGPERRRCSPRTVTLATMAPATDADRNLIAAIEGPLGRVLAVLDRGATFVELSGAITEGGARHDGMSALPDCLLRSAVALLTEGGTEVKVATELAGKLTASVGSF